LSFSSQLNRVFYPKLRVIKPTYRNFWRKFRDFWLPKLQFITKFRLSGNRRNSRCFRRKRITVYLGMGTCKNCLSYRTFVWRHNTTQHNTTQHNTTQHNTTQMKKYIYQYILFANLFKYCSTKFRIKPREDMGQR
jgi:hypothetical protein